MNTFARNPTQQYLFELLKGIIQTDYNYPEEFLTLKLSEFLMEG